MATRPRRSLGASNNSRVALTFDRSGDRSDALFSPAECDAAIAWAEAPAADDSDPGWIRVFGRDQSDAAWERSIFDRRAGNPVASANGLEIAWLVRKLRRLGDGLNRQIWRFDLTGWSEVSIRRYDAGDQATLHSDLGPATHDRKILLLVQLSPAHSYAGGALVFYDPALVASRARGSVIAFPSWVLHRVTPITFGQRYVAGCFALGPSFR